MEWSFFVMPIASLRGATAKRKFLLLSYRFAQGRDSKEEILAIILSLCSGARQQRGGLGLNARRGLLADENGLGEADIWVGGKSLTEAARKKTGLVESICSSCYNKPSSSGAFRSLSFKAFLSDYCGT